MRALHEYDHYEVLEIRRGAAPDEIERAYRAVRATYDPESLALYSVFGERDAAVIRERVEEAYRVLSDGEARRAYDRATADGIEIAVVLEEPVPSIETSLVQHVEVDHLGGASDAFRELEAEIEEESGEFDGPKLRRARLRLGFELKQIADITKVSVANLTRIENEEFADLPATVYVRGFVTAYARTIGLDPDPVVADYVARTERARANPGRSRLRGRDQA